ncbi:MAG TPA: alpha/beta hydrolase, partial [Saprospiraceae bacterium]|nr:alpha/beta hydrolase [Saprospiraceae bacterium]
MKQLSSFLILISFISFAPIKGISQEINYEETPIVLKTPTGDIKGTLTVPKSVKKFSIALIIAGSGPTDRNGNNKYAMNESLRLLAHELANAKIASVRYDKRGIAESESAMTAEADLRFEDYVNDAKAWVDLIKADPRFKEVVIIGHSEGSLIGMMAAEKAEGYVSIAGAGRPADEVLLEQLSSIPETMKKSAFAALDTLKQGKTATITDNRLYSIFRTSVQ